MLFTIINTKKDKIISLPIFCILGLTLELFSWKQNRAVDDILLVSGLISTIFWCRYTYNERNRPYLSNQKQVIGLCGGITAILICFESALIWYGSYVSSSLPYADFVHTTICGIGIFATLVGVLGLLITNTRYHSDGILLCIFSLTVLGASVFSLSICHDTTLDRSIKLWWIPYLLKEGGFLIAEIVAIHFSSHRKNENTERKII